MGARPEPGGRQSLPAARGTGAVPAGGRPQVAGSGSSGCAQRGWRGVSGNAGMCGGLWSPVLVWAPSPASCLASGTSLCSEVTSTRHLQSSDLSGKGRGRRWQSPSWTPAGLGGHLVCLPGLSSIVSLEHSVDSTFGHTWAQRVSVAASVEQCPGLSAQNSGRLAGVKPSSPPATAGPRALGLCVSGFLPADWPTG